MNWEKNIVTQKKIQLKFILYNRKNKIYSDNK